MNSFTVDDINNIHQSYKDFFDKNAVEIQRLFELRSEKFIEWIRYRYNIGIGDVIQHKKETYFGKPKTVWILGLS